MDTIVRSLPISDERDLLIAVQNGNAEAFATLYDRYHAAVFRFANRMLPDASTAEDIVQGVFISLWKSPPEYCPGAFQRWLFRVTRNRVLDALRAHKARRESMWPDDIVAPGCLDDIIAAMIDGRRVRLALEGLPEAQRQLIELGFFGERSHAELAELTQLPLGTVKTRIRAGLQKLRYTLSASATAV